MASKEHQDIADRIVGHAINVAFAEPFTLHLEEDELREPVQRAGIDIVRLIAPTTDDARLPKVLADASGFVYYVSIAGITGTKSPSFDAVTTALARLRRHTELPVTVGFGIKTAEQAAEVARIADAAAVGSAIVQRVAEHLDEDGRPRESLVDAVLGFVGELAAGVRNRGR